jgi:hypothetical protein
MPSPLKKGVQPSLEDQIILLVVFSSTDSEATEPTGLKINT